MTIWSSWIECCIQLCQRFIIVTMKQLSGLQYLIALQERPNHIDTTNRLRDFVVRFFISLWRRKFTPQKSIRLLRESCVGVVSIYMCVCAVLLCASVNVFAGVGCLFVNIQWRHLAAWLCVCKIMFVHLLQRVEMCGFYKTNEFILTEIIADNIEMLYFFEQ